MTWEPTKHGGFRRTGVAQEGTTRTLAPGQSSAQIKRKPVVRVHPPVLIRFREKLGLPECPYVIRWRIETPAGSLRLHHWLAPDDDRALHDHPWSFLIFVVRGGYRDVSPVRDDYLLAPAVRFRRSSHRHSVVPFPGGAWTVMVTGPVVRRWGFWPDGKFVRANKYFLSHGHHPCR